MPQSEHTVRSYDDELNDLSQKIAEMGGLAEMLVGDSVTALVRRDSALAQRIISDDQRVDRLQRQIEDSAILIIAKRQPMALDLREIMAAIHVANDLERIGDLAKNTAKRVIAIEGNFAAQRLVAGVEHIAELSLAQLKRVLDAYAARDVAAALEVWERDDEIDAMYTSLFRELLTYMMEDPRNITFCTHLLFCAKNLERIGDHATNIAETVQYLVTGVPLTDERPKKDTTSTTAVEYRRRRETGMTPRVMIVEDEEPLSLMLRYNLESEGYQVDTVERGDDAETRLRENVPDLLLLDWMLPGVSGIELCRRLRTREATRSLPIIMLTARGEEQERVRGLATGADDYVVKPFSVPELMARVRAILRRSRPELIATVLKSGEIELDRDTHRVRRRGRELHLGPTEFRLLEFLMQAPGRVFARAQLLDGVWGRDVYVDERTVDVHVGRLRKALGPGRDPIRTVRGSGYSFDEDFAGAG